MKRQKVDGYSWIRRGWIRGGGEDDGGEAMEVTSEEEASPDARSGRDRHDTSSGEDEDSSMSPCEPREESGTPRFGLGSPEEAEGSRRSASVPSLSAIIEDDAISLRHGNAPCEEPESESYDYVDDEALALSRTVHCQERYDFTLPPGAARAAKLAYIARVEKIKPKSEPTGEKNDRHVFLSRDTRGHLTYFSADRWDAQFASLHVERDSCNLSVVTWLRSKQVAKYPLGTNDWVLVFFWRPKSDDAPEDEDWAGDLETCMGVILGDILCGHHLMESWKFPRRASSTGSAESEFYVPTEVGEKAYRETTFKDLLNEIE